MTLALVGPSSGHREFVQVFNRLCVALREKDVDESTMLVYFEALRDLPFAAVQAGAQALQIEAGRKWFPTTGEWRQAAEKAALEQLKAAVQPARETPWQMDCSACDDTGWKGFQCPGDTTCERTETHLPHTFVRVCPCRPTNRTYQRHQHFGNGAA